MSEEKLVPKLRFNGFNNGWNEDYLNKLFDNRNERNFENLEVLSVTINDGVLKRSDLGSDRKNKDKKSMKHVLKGDLVYNPMFMWKGASGISSYEGITSADYIVLKSKKDVNSIFFSHLFQTEKSLNKFKNYSQGSLLERLRLMYPQFSDIKMAFPDYDEQEKIANFLTSIDNKIELLEKKYQSYLDFKKYLMQQIFAQKLRFNKTSEWETYSLNDIGETYNGLSGLSKDNFEKGNSKYITYKSIFDNNILKSDFTENVELNNKSQNEVKKGDLFFTGSSETPEEVGMVSVLNQNVKDCYLNSFCFGFRLNNEININPLFLAYYLRSPIMRNKIMILAQGSTRFNLSKKEILKLKIEIPSINEQQQVIDLFQSVDNKINEISIQTNKFNEFKKGLLQQMFV